MSLVLLSRDLVTSSRVEGVAMRQQVAMKTVGSIAQAIETATEPPAALVIADLTTAGLDIAALVAGLQPLSPSPRVVAFGPHVHEAALAAAAEAGCDAVMSRGQFFAQLDDVVAAAAAKR